MFAVKKEQTPLYMAGDLEWPETCVWPEACARTGMSCSADDSFEQVLMLDSITDSQLGKSFPIEIFYAIIWSMVLRLGGPTAGILQSRSQTAGYPVVLKSDGRPIRCFGSPTAGYPSVRRTSG